MLIEVISSAGTKAQIKAIAIAAIADVKEGSNSPNVNVYFDSGVVMAVSNDFKQLTAEWHKALGLTHDV